MLGKGQGLGSNSWVVDGQRSTTGEPILANDPHLGISVPGVWYQVGLHFRVLSAECPFDVSGFTFAGLPGVVIGHNQQIAWGFTNLGPDVVDLFLEKVEGKTYLYDNKRRKLDIRQESIEIAGEDEPVEFDVRSTRHGPLLSDVSTELSTVGANANVSERSPARGNGYGVALSWTALSPMGSADAIFLMDKATSWDEFRAAAEEFDAPSQNMVYADKDGHIGYQAQGLIPIRKSGNTGDYPAEGWRSANDWTGSFIPFESLPSVLDPDEGRIVTANQAVIGNEYPPYLTNTWTYGYRSDRILDLLEDKARLSVDDMAAIQLDDRNTFAPTFVPYLLDILLPSPYLASGQQLLADWDYDQSVDSAAAAYFNSVWRQTLALTFRDQLPESIWPEGGDRWYEVMRRLLAEPNSLWWDDLDTESVVETRDEILFLAMSRARDELVRLQSRRPVEWTWGHHHRMNLENQSLGQSDIGLVGRLFNRGSYRVAGGGDLVNATQWDASSEGFSVTAAASMRMVVSLADFDASRWINLTGASGHAFNDHYVDQTELWVDVVVVERVAGGAGQVDPAGRVEIGERDDHPHGRSRSDRETLGGGVPLGGVDQVPSSGYAIATPVEQPADQPDVGLAKALVLQVHPVVMSPGPFHGAPRLETDELVACTRHGQEQDLVAGLHDGLGVEVVPPQAVRLRKESAHHLVPPVAALRPDRLGQLVPERQCQCLSPHRVEVGRGGGVDRLVVVPVG